MLDNWQLDVGGIAPVLSVVLWSGRAGGWITGFPPKRVTEGFPRLTSASAHGAPVQHPEIR